MDKARAEDIRLAIKSAVEEKAKELGMALDGGLRARYGDSDMKFNFILSEASPGEEFETKEEKAFKARAQSLGLNPGMLGKVFIDTTGQRVRLTGLNPRARSYPISLVRLSDGKPFKCSVYMVKLWKEAS